MLHKILILILALLGVYMLYLGNKSGMMPPSITGIGFLLIATIFALKKD